LGNVLTNIFGKKPEWKIKPEHQVELAFKGSDGTEYYHMTTGYNSYYERYMAFTDRVAEIEQRIDNAYLKTYLKVQNEYINKGDLRNISIQSKHLEDRMSYVCNVEFLYNLASVWFFDKSENPYTYDYEYADKKIKRWKRDAELLVFFCHTPLKDYMPLPDTLIANIKTYEKGQYLNELSQLKYHLRNISKESKNKEVISMLESRVTELEELVSIL
jgi:hypothetical protein